ncbi:MAG: hypothetical protein Q8J85_04780 [Sulfuricurvum sp.]|jgi:hypothetical protein|nr:hypothetical protein [Sulfuricurvum sp.]MDP3022720.1 hypothetical protein [Sulfuricurvum sp.]
MKKIKVMSIELDDVTIRVSDVYTTGECLIMVTGFKGRMVKFLALEVIDNKYYDLDLPITYCDVEALLDYELVRRAA